MHRKRRSTSPIEMTGNKNIPDIFTHVTRDRLHFTVDI
jgi:hypothetical protein